MKNLVWIAMMGVIGFSFEAVCQEEAPLYPVPPAEPVRQTGGGFGGFVPGAGGGGMTGMPMMVLPSFEMQKKTALIIPAGPMDAELMGQITEDMHVMSQILYEKIHPEEVQPNKYLRWVGGFFGDGRETQVAGLYLQGYGMVFLQQVDFPLMPMGEQPAAAEPSGGRTDEVWLRTQKKLQGQYEETEKSEAPKYDAAQVDKLKETIVLSLVHAANIRHLDEAEQVTVVVKSSSYRSNLQKFMDSYAGSGKVMMKIESPQSVQEQPSFMVIRAQKKDIDDFAKGRMDQPKFTEKVSVISY
jgi:hypothetical protein